MKLSDRLARHGFEPVASPDPQRNNPKLKVYTNGGGLYVGFQKIGNVFRVDVLPTYMGILPGEKALDNQIVPKEQLGEFIESLMPQLAGQEPL